MINFHELYNKYADDIYRFVYWLSGNRQDAQDITSETFMRALINKNSIQLQTVKGYLLTIARNLYLQKMRNTKNYELLHENLQDEFPTAEKNMEIKSELQATLNAIQKLSEPDRSVLIMHAQHQMPYGEIAAATGFSLSAVKVKVHRARLKLQTYLRGEHK